MSSAKSSLMPAFAVLVIAIVVGTGALPEHRAAGPRHFIFFGLERDRIADSPFLSNENIAGAQLKYTWRELEPARDRYELRRLLGDLAFLERHGKRLFVQLQDVSFSDDIPVPDYLITDPAFGGGVARKYEGEGQSTRFDGWVARRWDPAVRARFGKLLEVLGKELDGRIEGLNLPETAIGFGETGQHHPAGFTYERYVDGMKQIMTAAREAFPRSCVILYANFMPGEWLPGADRGYLRAVYAHAESIWLGVGGPDLRPHRRGQLNHSYPLIASRDAKIRAGVAVQDGNLDDTNPATGEPVTAAEYYAFARDRLRLDYIFWGTQEPHYSQQVLPFIRALPRDGAR
jgi:hypothetical protein